VIPPGRPSLTVFAVEDTTVQVVWRNLAAGPMRLSARHTDVAVDVVLHDAPTGRAEAATDLIGPAGALVLHGLPPGTHVTIEATGEAVARALRAGDTPRLTATARTLDPLPGAELSRVSTISDLHLGTWVFGHRGTIVETPTPVQPHPVRCAEAAMQEAAAWGADRLVVKGDITNYGKPDEWRSYAALVHDVAIPVDAVPGNHDRPFIPNDLRAITPEEATVVHSLDVASPVVVRDLPGLRVLVVDTTQPGNNRGQLRRSADQIYQAVREADPSGSVLIALHHHLHQWPIPEGVPLGVGHRESRAFVTELGRLHPRTLVTSGHTHRHRRWTYDGVTVTQVGSTKDYPGVWAGYVAHEGGLRQVVRRIERPDCIRWTDRSRWAAFGSWQHLSPGSLASRCFDLTATSASASTSASP